MTTSNRWNEVVIPPFSCVHSAQMKSSFHRFYSKFASVFLLLSINFLRISSISLHPPQTLITVCKSASCVVEGDFSPSTLLTHSLHTCGGTVEGQKSPSTSRGAENQQLISICGGWRENDIFLIF